MSGEPGRERQPIDPGNVRNPGDLSLALSVLRKRAGITVRELAVRSGFRPARSVDTSVVAICRGSVTWR